MKGYGKILPTRQNLGGQQKIGLQFQNDGRRGVDGLQACAWSLWLHHPIHLPQFQRLGL
jgi:hypothetical protein